MDCARPYRGRFAPSPTGPLHFGSIVTAVASYLDARAHAGTWLIRMEDVDRTREEPGAAAAILDGLATLGMTSDEPVLRQSDRDTRYESALGVLHREGIAFGCKCSRQEMPRCRCADLHLSEADVRVWRMCVPDEEIRFADRLFGEHIARPHAFTLRRSDGLFSYSLAVVVDDADQAITDVVRGSDLLDATAQQIVLQRALGLPTPRYFHVPVVTDGAGRKLSKQNRAPAAETGDPGKLLKYALTYLCQPETAGVTPDEILREAAGQWHPDRLNIQASRRLPHRFS